MFMRATLNPPATRAPITSGEELVGPRVQTILVLSMSSRV